MNFWIKTQVGDKIVFNKVVRNKLPLTRQNAVSVLQQTCHELDIPTPVFTKSHYENIDKFNYVKFRRSDFVEQVDFDCLIVEYFIDK